MAKTSAALAYAKALLELSSDQGSLEKTKTEMEQLGRMVKGSADLRQLFANPTVTDAERRTVIEDLVTRLGFQRTTRNFLMVLADKRRLALLGDVCREFQQLADARSGVARAKVYSTVALGTMQIARLKAALEKTTAKRVQIENIVDASILGGLRIQVEGKVLDGTIRAQLDAIRENILPAA